MVLVVAVFLIVSVVALPLLSLLHRQPPPGPPKPPPLGREENLTRTISGRGLELRAGTIKGVRKSLFLWLSAITVMNMLIGVLCEVVSEVLRVGLVLPPPEEN